MALRDAGWVQLYAASSQEAADLHLQAFVLAERLSLPVMVCLDGFVLTHAVDEVDLPDQAEVDAFVPPFRPRQVLDPTAPITIGAMVGPEAFTEVRYLTQARMQDALVEVPRIADEFASRFPRRSGGLVHAHRTEDADTILVTIGSVAGAAAEVVDELRSEGVPVGSLAITCFRPWPAEAVRSAVSRARRVVVLERAFSPGAGSIVGQDVRRALHDRPVTVVETVAGLGGRPVRRTDIRLLLEDARDDALEPGTLHFIDLDRALLARTGVY
jgi:pyruvate ferredoxin oxidoreductase alpha subunit